jgi:dynein heavy chain
MRRYYYVTPTSYLILIKTFSGMLDKKRNNIDSQIKKFDRGLTQLAAASSSVGELQVKLTALIPVLEVKAANSAKMQKEIEVKKKIVDQTVAECKVEEDSAKQ